MKCEIRDPLGGKISWLQKQSIRSLTKSEWLWVSREVMGKIKITSGNVNLGGKPSCKSMKSSQSVPHEEGTRVPTYPPATSKSHWREGEINTLLMLREKFVF